MDASKLSLSNILETFKGYKPLHRVFGIPVPYEFVKDERIPLEAFVEKFSGETITPIFSGSWHALVLELRGYGNAAEYSQFYSSLLLDLGNHLSQEIYDLLKQGKNARFNGELIVSKYLELLPLPLTTRIGELKGDLSVGGNTYYAEFVGSRLVTPKLKRIDKK